MFARSRKKPRIYIMTIEHYDEYMQMFGYFKTALRDYNITFAKYKINDVDDFDYTVEYGTDTNKNMTRGYCTEIRYISACGAYFVRIHNFDDDCDILNIHISVNHFESPHALVEWLHMIIFIHSEP